MLVVPAPCSCLRSERARRIHSEWLERALRTCNDLPRIPVLRVRDGGFALLMAQPGGPACATEWWRRTLELPGLE